MGLGDQIRTQGLPSRRGAGKHPELAAGTSEEPWPRRGVSHRGTDPHGSKVGFPYPNCLPEASLEEENLKLPLPFFIPTIQNLIKV